MQTNAALSPLEVLLIIAVVLGSVYIFIYLPNNPEPKIDVKTIPDDSLRPLVGKLMNKIEELQLQDFKQKNQIFALQQMAGIEREQSKFLTANVNKLVDHHHDA